MVVLIVPPAASYGPPRSPVGDSADLYRAVERAFPDAPPFKVLKMWEMTSEQEGRPVGYAVIMQSELVALTDMFVEMEPYRGTDMGVPEESIVFEASDDSVDHDRPANHVQTLDDDRWYPMFTSKLRNVIRALEELAEPKPAKPRRRALDLGPPPPRRRTRPKKA